VFPTLLVFCIDFALIVTCRVASVCGAMKSPAALMEPALADQFTPLEQAWPVHTSVKLHWLVWFGCIVDGLQVAVTAVTLPMSLLPPQAAIVTTKPSAVMNPNIRTV
jgi:hypothetical protein